MSKKFQAVSKKTIFALAALIVAVLALADGWIWMLTVGSLHGSYGHPVQTIGFPVGVGQAFLLIATAGVFGAAFRGNK